MKYIAPVILFCILNFTSSYGQGHTPGLSPEDTLSFIKMELTNPDGTPYANSLVVLKGEKGHWVKVMTGKDGRVKAKVPFDEIYTVHCGEHTCMRKIKVNAFPYVTYNYKAYTQRFIYFTFTYQNINGERLKGEEVVLHSSTGKTYMDSTNQEGQVSFYLPFDPSFRIAVKYHDNVKTITPRDVGKEYKLMTTVFTWMGAREKERRAHIADSLARLAHLSATELLDSLVASGKGGEIAEKDIYIPINYDSTEWVIKMLGEKAKQYHSKLKENPAFFEQKNKTVLAPLYRLRKKMAQKIIVTDITGSMYGYTEEVVLWHALNFMENSPKKYLFFNDGDHKATAQKTIGSTGGLYFCQGQIKDFKTILNSMRKGMRNGGGGDGPENDIEALLAAKQHCNEGHEIFLIADNYSPIRDLELMEQLNVPIRIILCGVEYKSCFRDHQINEEYLNLAHATGGSIHLIKEDIYHIAQIKEGETITINKNDYHFVNGRFLLQKKM
ncbi:hypothetical protein [Aureispira anguillae]|uniref:VWFA domain-containing protein n=1 Tax=Aureispira anguillae TaxID=2864201 RepID=A0A916DQ17_9BACT|nr:hypothetical protein [Aureispira anguillae]BDS09835.1 hypothetical protein AsAng_0005400 [Aureispira anguillae]